jgi:hypothetical protein
MLQGDHFSADLDCTCGLGCYICYPGNIDQEVGHYLEWVGQGYYKEPKDFTQEAAQMGVSRRLKTGVPRNLVIGKTVIFLAHRNCETVTRVLKNDRSRVVHEKSPAIFMAFVVNRLEHIVTESELENYKEFVNALTAEHENDKRMKQLYRMVSQGVTLVAVPDDDPDHK